MDRRSTALGQFSIHPETGELSVAAPLDRETQPRYNLIVQAYDNHQFGFATGDSRHAFVQVAVTVSDVNDERPVFVRDVVQGAVAGLPVKLFIEGQQALWLVPTAFADDFEERILEDRETAP